jgi:hypothetical protein
MGKASLSSAQIGRAPTFGRNGLNLESSASVQVGQLHIYMCGAHMIYPEPIPSPPCRDRSKTNKSPIPILSDAVGCPELPTVTADDNYNGKVVQIMFRDFFTAHLRELIP